MKSIRLMHAKLHQITVTQTNKNYVGSITIDEILLERVGMLPLEEVYLVNLRNGKRWTTYTLPGEKNSGIVAPNGGGAFMCKPGDLLIVWAYESIDRQTLQHNNHEARVLLVDSHNVEKKFFRQSISFQGKLYDFKAE